MWALRLVESTRMKYLGIVDALEADIRAGVAPRGERLPPQRAVAEALSVDLTTVTRAFGEALRQLPSHWLTADFAAQVGLTTQVSEAVRLRLGVAPDREVLAQGLTQLAAPFASHPSPVARAVVQPVMARYQSNPA